MTAEPSVNASGAVGVGPWERTAEEFRRWSAGTLIALLCGAAVLVGWRRLASALREPLGTPVLLMVGALMVMTVVGIRILWRRAAAQTRWRSDWLPMILPTGAMVALGAALSLPETAAGGLAAFWALLLGEELWAWRPLKWRKLPRKQSVPRPVRTDPPHVAAPHPAAVTSFEEMPAADVLQQLTRSQADDGSEQLAGWLRMPFSAGQRTASVHVAFCPPFAKTPQVMVEQLDGPPARIKTAQLLPYGARLDLKLSAMSEDADSVLLQFFARSQGEP